MNEPDGGLADPQQQLPLLMPSIPSPYEGIPPAGWGEITNKLLKKHPLRTGELVEVVLAAWEDIFRSRIGKRGFRVGKDFFPRPQIMAFFLHELIPLEFASRYPKLWRREESSSEKDLVYLPDQRLSLEIKTSSHPDKIFGNRSYAQKVKGKKRAKKEKSGYHLAVNFGKFSGGSRAPQIAKVRFGWLDHTDWTGQKEPTGQNASLSRDAETLKLLELYPKSAYKS